MLQSCKSRGVCVLGSRQVKSNASDDGLSGMHVHEHRRRPSSVIHEGPCMPCRMPQGSSNSRNTASKKQPVKRHPKPTTGPTHAKHECSAIPQATRHMKASSPRDIRPLPKNGVPRPSLIGLVELAPAPEPNAHSLKSEAPIIIPAQRIGPQALPSS